MPNTYHLQHIDQVTFIATRQDDQWTAICVGLSTADALQSLDADPPLTSDLVIQALDPTVLIEATKASPFQKQVWRAICQMGPGEVTSYSELASRIGRPKAFRAVANACGANRYAGVIPCHRVIGSNGKLGGYRWGPQVKAAILTAEQSVRDNLEQA